MFDILFQVLFVIIQIIFRSFANIFLCSFLSQILMKWFGLHYLLSFICATYSVRKINNFIQNFRLNYRLKRKTPDEQISLDQLSWISSKINNNQSTFEIDWNYLLNDDKKTILSFIFDIPFQSGFLFIIIIIILNYQLNNNSNENYFISLVRMIGFIIILISGSAIRYQTLFERQRTNYLNLLIKNQDEYERYIIYSKTTIPIASICLQKINQSENIIELYQLNSKFNDYFYHITNYICQNLIQQMKTNKKIVRLIWSIPTCKKTWTHAIKANKFILNKTYKDFSFMPFIHSYIEQFEYQDLSLDNTKKSQ